MVLSFIQIEDDSEVVEIKDEPPQKEEVIYNPKAKEERVPMEEREEAGYEEQSHLSRVLDIERRWQRKLNYRCEGRVEGRKEMFYLKTHSTHFNYGYMASDVLEKGRMEMFYLTMHSTHFNYGYMASGVL